MDATDNHRIFDRDIDSIGSKKEVFSLSEEQSATAAFILSSNNDKSVFITGPAGTGKSYLLRYITQQLKAKYAIDVRKVAVTASTGIAAATISGTTLHSFAGIGYGGGVDKLISRVQRNSTAQTNWKSVQYLIIDEISMIDADLFDKLEALARAVRGSDQWFGGVQLVMCGDFFQLPPVSVSAVVEPKFAFQSKSWRDDKIRPVQLLEVQRQRTDAVFIDLLNELRTGILSSRSKQLLDSCHESNKSLPSDKNNLAPTKLYCRNADVDEENSKRLADLSGEERVFDSIDHWLCKPTNEKERQDILKAIAKTAPERLALKLHAPVILTRNMPNWNLVNGSRGVVVAFSDKEEEDDEEEEASDSHFVRVRFENRMVVDIVAATAQHFDRLRRQYIPLRLAWALTIHKSQGLSLSQAVVDASHAFACGQVYVALSRVQSLEGLWLIGDKVVQSDVFAHPVVLSKYHPGLQPPVDDRVIESPSGQSRRSWPAKTMKGTDCKLCLDLDPNGFCQFHNEKVSTPQKLLYENSVQSMMLTQRSPDKRWPAKTMKGTDCKLCLDLGTNCFCHFHNEKVSPLKLPLESPVKSIWAMQCVTDKRWPAKTMKGTDCLKCLGKGPNVFCHHHV